MAKEKSTLTNEFRSVNIEIRSYFRSVHEHIYERQPNGLMGNESKKVREIGVDIRRVANDFLKKKLRTFQGDFKDIS